ncbi:Transcription initiation factor IIE subunit alpha [Forsythia ovata]|uniref:Transcription initiation factor IIE subunit alpha n=1 Tax=Forsythia ovata TaxID=205694 RepID=A0ABD1PGD5_9LAMI
MSMIREYNVGEGIRRNEESKKPEYEKIANYLHFLNWSGIKCDGIVWSLIYDAVRYRLHHMKKKLKDELESKKVQEYICPNCSKRCTALDALQLISPDDEDFHCERCNGVLVAESEKQAAQELGDSAMKNQKICYKRWRFVLFLIHISRGMEQLKPLMDQLAIVKDLPIPEFRSFHELEANANGDSTIPRQHDSYVDSDFAAEVQTKCITDSLDSISPIMLSEV